MIVAICSLVSCLCFLAMLIEIYRLRDKNDTLIERSKQLGNYITRLDESLDYARKFPTEDYIMSADEFQERAVTTAVYPDEHKIVYPAIGLADETGEVLGKVKKTLRGDYVLSEEKRKEIVKELGDVLWYAAALARDLGVTLSHVQHVCLDKLSDRANRGVIKGDGDNR